LPSLDRLSRFGIVEPRKERALATTMCSQLNVRAPSVRQIVGLLSGGNQQKVVLGKWLGRTPRLLILDEPTRGIDVGAKYEIYTIINELAAGGKGIVFISSEMPELLGMCDRILVMSEGRIVGDLPIAEASQEKIMHMFINADG
jgi:putative multiple sugar transport system ATP-binding protein